MSEASRVRMSVEQLVSTKWTIPVLQSLIGGPARFSDLFRRIPEVSANVLTKRLRDLEQEGLIARIHLPPPADRQVYALTPRGAAMRDIIEAVRALSERWDDDAHDAPDQTGTSA